MRLTFCYLHVAPYHHARLRELHGRHASVTVIEYGDIEGVAFEEFAGARTYNTIKPGELSSDWASLYRSLEQASPEVLLLPGWGHAYMLAALGWALENRVPVVAISDSTEIDKRRRKLGEVMKARIVELFPSGLVAGQRSREYLMKLGMPKDRIFEGCDVVDNKHFKEGSELARHNAASLREKLGLPQKYFLAVNRLIPEKNLLRLLQAYAGYRRSGAPGDWKLVIVGNGKLKETILRSRAELGIEPHVLLTGSKFYEELPYYYGLASAFILASVFFETWGLVVNEAMAAGLPVMVSRYCGCVDDLVEEGVNGYTFDPYDINALTIHMLKMAGGEYDLPSMAEAGQRIISRWSVERCAENTMKAAEMALRVPRPRPNMIDKLLLKVARKKLSKNF